MSSFSQILSATSGVGSIQQLAAFKRETFVPVNTTTNLVLTNQIIPGFELIFKNAAFLIPTTDYTISGKTITLGVAANGTDAYTVHYHFRAS